MLRRPARSADAQVVQTITTVGYGDVSPVRRRRRRRRRVMQRI
jgi:hypothetical protein